MDEFDLLLRGDAFGGRPAAQPAGGATRGRRVAHAAVPGPDRDGPRAEAQDGPEAGQYSTSASPEPVVAPVAGELPGFAPPPMEVPVFSAPPPGPSGYDPPAAEDFVPTAAARPSWAPPVAPPPVLEPMAPPLPTAPGRPQAMTWVEPPGPAPAWSEEPVPAWSQEPVPAWSEGPAPQLAAPADPVSYEVGPQAAMRGVPGVSMPGPTPMPALPYRPGDEEQASKHAWMGPDGLVIPGYRSPTGA